MTTNDANEPRRPTPTATDTPATPARATATPPGGPRGLPLAGLNVLELGHIVAGPTAGQILADLGADVTKIESVDGGDQSRRMPGSNAAVFHFLNRNKRSVALDLKGAGRDVFLRLAARADVIVDNFSYGAVDALGIGYDVVAATNPRLVWLAIKGFLPGGPDERRPLLDELAQMMGGLAFMTGPRGQPMRAGASVIDVGAGTYGVIAVLAALRQRDADGRGQKIVAGLFETTVYWVGQWMAGAQVNGQPSVPMPEIRQGARMGWGVYQLFDTADGRQVFIGVTSNAHWDRFCAALGLHALHADPRFADNAGRVASRHELAAAIAQAVGALDYAEVADRLRASDVPFAPLNRPDQLADDPHLLGSNQLVEMPMADGVTARLPKLPFRADAYEMGLRRPAPALGGDTRAVMRELGYDDAQIDALAASGAVLDAPHAE